MGKRIMIWLMVMICWIPIPVNAEYDIPEYVKVGVRSGSNAVATVKLASGTGFDFGYLSEGNFISLYDLSHIQNLYARKDSYFIHLNDYFYEYNYNPHKDENNSNITGPIHIQLGGSFSSKTDAVDFINSIEAFNLSPFLALDGKWKVWLGFYTSYDQAEKRFDELKYILQDIDLTVISKNSKRVQVLDEKGDILFIYNPSNGDYYFSPKDDALITMDNKEFRGSIMIKNASNGNMTLINRLKMDKYLYGVLPKEMSYTAPIEALKAQSVAARNYAVVNINRHKNENFHVCASTHCQVYGGYSVEKQSCIEAVDATSNMILLHDGLPISTYYHSNSGGHTENIENVWESAIPYLKGVKDPFSKDYLWEISYTPKELSDVLRIKGYNIGEILDVYVGGISEFGSVQVLVVEGTEGTVALEKDNIRKILGYTTIKSLKFGIHKDNALCIENNLLKQNQKVENISIINGDGEVRKLIAGESMMITNGMEIGPFLEKHVTDAYYFKGNGYGHGIGMSQNGAIAMANSGYTFEEILKHYYTNVSLVEIVEN
ncbi:MAG: SpoIID/LytB domain-containing protein [Clostridia bacterium]|nr:SpoIID/LytB domain-containing protein [Clostridia bacterium]